MGVSYLLALEDKIGRRRTARMNNLEVTHPTQQESVCTAVVLDLVDMTLTDVAEVGSTEREAVKRHIYAEQMTIRECVARMREAYVMIGIAEGEQLVVALSIVGTEHHPQQGDIQLIAQQ